MRRVAVVTGGASGIGLGVARQFVTDNYLVAILDRNKVAATELQSAGGTILALETDVADQAAVNDAFARVRSELGPVSILVTSAGIEAFDPFLTITQERWEQIISVNLTGTFFCVQAAISDMVEAGWGRIVTISSQSAQSELQTWRTTLPLKVV